MDFQPLIDVMAIMHSKWLLLGVLVGAGMSYSNRRNMANAGFTLAVICLVIFMGELHWRRAEIDAVAKGETHTVKLLE